MGNTHYANHRAVVRKGSLLPHAACGCDLRRIRNAVVITDRRAEVTCRSCLSIIARAAMAEYEVVLNDGDREVVARNGSLSWTRAELNRLFDRVATAENWKLPIDATVTMADDRELLGTREAVVFYTGSVPSIDYIGRRGYRVRARGYYEVIGA